MWLPVMWNYALIDYKLYVQAAEYVGLGNCLEQQIESGNFQAVTVILLYTFNFLPV